MEIENWYKVENGVYLHAIDEGNKLLSETNITADYQVKRVLTIIQLSITLLLVSLSYTLSTTPKIEGLYILSIILDIELSIILIYGSFSYKSYTVNPLGNNPKNIITSQIIDTEENMQLKSILYSSANRISNAILENQKSNYKRASQIRNLEWIIGSSFLILILFALLWWVAVLFLSLS